MHELLRAWRPAPGDWSPAAATHLTRRAGFGPAPGEVDALLALDVDAAVDRVLAADAHDEALQDGVRALLPTQDIDRLAGWWMSLILAGGAPLRERVTLMWHDHFATSDAKLDDPRLMHAQNELLRDRGLGDFRELLHAMARDPAMLLWLDGGSNRRGQPNENFAREVMELFALGIGHYSEQDVQEAARAFTGWGTRGRSFVHRPEHHDGGEKRLFGRSGPLDGDDAIDAILAHPACPRHVARRLLAEFVAPDPSEEWVQATAMLLLEQGWHVGRTIETLLRSRLFFSPAARRTRIAGPVELVASTARMLGARLAPQRATRAAADMGQSLLRPPSVKGWDGMRAWINAGTWVARHNTLHGMAFAHGHDDSALRVDLRRAFPAATSPEEVPGVVLATLLPDDLDSPFARALGPCARSLGDLDDTLRGVTALVLTSPEYQST